MATIYFSRNIIQHFAKLRLCHGFLQTFPTPGKIIIHTVFAAVPVQTGVMGFLKHADKENNLAELPAMNIFSQGKRMIY